jgi:hypothetical protein
MPRDASARSDRRVRSALAAAGAAHHLVDGSALYGWTITSSPSGVLLLRCLPTTPSKFCPLGTRISASEYRQPSRLSNERFSNITMTRRSIPGLSGGAVRWVLGSAGGAGCCYSAPAPASPPTPVPGAVKPAARRKSRRDVRAPDSTPGFSSGALDMRSPCEPRPPPRPAPTPPGGARVATFRQLMARLLAGSGNPRSAGDDRPTARLHARSRGTMGTMDTVPDSPRDRDRCERAERAARREARATEAIRAIMAGGDLSAEKLALSNESPTR